jgi:hypothetical protein
MRIGVLACVVLLATASPAIGEPRKTETRWYGWQTLIVDGVALAVMIPAAHEEELEAVAYVMLGDVIAAPIVHARRGHWGRFGASLTIRGVLGIATVAGVIDAADCHDLCSKNGEVAALIPFVLASALDAGVIAREDVPPPPPRTPPSLTPTVITRPGNVLIGVAGSF